MNNIVLSIGIFIIILCIVCYFVESRCQKKFDKEMAECRKEYDHKIYQFEENFKKLSAKHESLESKHEILLKDNKDYEVRLKTLRDEKYKLEYQSSQFQKELYAARKRIKKLLGYKQK